MKRVMVKRLVPLLACALLGLPASAGAAEEQLESYPASGLTATSGWASWAHNLSDHDEWVLRHGDAYVDRPQVIARTLGTDAKGRGVALEWPCASCRAVERRLSDGSVRALPRRVVHVADEFQGTLAYSRGDKGIYLLRKGARHVVRVSRAVPVSVALAGRWLVYWSRDRTGQVDIRAIDVSRAKPRERLLANDPDVDSDCRCTSSYHNQIEPTVDGHFAYWVQRVVTELEPGGGGGKVEYSILRVDLNAHRPVIWRYDASGAAESLAVSGGTLYYAGGSFAGAAGVFRVANPTWQKTPFRVPYRT